MSTAPSNELERFRDVVERRFGWHFDDTRLVVLAEVLGRRGQGATARSRYVECLESTQCSRDELEQLAQDLTVGETYFLRNVEQFRAFTEVALPAQIAARGAARTLRILSAGCATGEEAYSLGMVARESPVTTGVDVQITGIDVNDASVKRARRGHYAAWALRETPDEVRARWFTPEGRELVIDASLRKQVRFEVHNLIDDDPVFWSPEVFDVVFCRNVLMYFSREAARAVVARIARSLTPGGHLFLGHAENLRGLSQDFHLESSHGTFYYRRRSALEPRMVEPSHALLEPPTTPGVAADDWATTWLATVQRSSARVRELSEHPLPPTQPPTLQPAIGRAQGAPTDTSHAVALLEQERFSDALEALRRAPRGAGWDSDTALLHAALLTHSGQLAAAEAACTELLAFDELNAGARYLIGLCREAVGDRSGAVEGHRAAAYLDPAFAMPRLHLGLLARRSGDRHAAQRELEAALALLSREDASRILLFGGGFTRSMLTELCRSELRAAGGEA